MKALKKTIAVSAVALLATGVVAADKKEERLKERVESRFSELDQNNNGVITYDEMMAHVKERFAAFDENGDGFLTLEELPEEMPIPEHARERMEKRAERMKARMEKQGKEFDPENMPSPKGKPTRMHFMAKHDRDGDERVSVEEFSGKAVRHFKRMDVNGDGQVTKDEAFEAAQHRRKDREHGEHGKKRDRDH